MQTIAFSTTVLVLAIGLTFTNDVAAASSHSGCTVTPEQALALSSAQPSESRQGYCVTGLRWDPLLRQQWLTAVSREHPEFPPIALLVPQEKQFHEGMGQPAPSLVHTGDAVRAWSQETMVRIEMAGVAEESAALGHRVRVRMARPSTGAIGGMGFSNAETVLGIVRGAHDVEIER